MCYTKEGALKDRREMLKVKAKSLAAEARIIRQEARRTRGELQSELTQHRRTVVRWAARETYVAYGLIRGTPLDKIEKPKYPRDEAFWKPVRTMIEKYGPIDREQRKEVIARCSGP